jgi:cell division protein FtsB
VTEGSTRIARPPRAAADAGRSRLGDSTRPIVRERRIMTDWRGTILLAVVALGIAGALAAALFLIPIRTLFDQHTRIDDRSEQVGELESVVADLQREVERLQTPDGVREAAREELGFIQSDEIRETVLEFPDLPLDLPDGWPYSLVNDITELRRGGPPPGAVTLPPIADPGQP